MSMLEHVCVCVDVCMGVCVCVCVCCVCLDVCVPHQVYVFGCCVFVAVGTCIQVCMCACKLKFLEKDLVTPEDRCWCENGEVWVSTGGKRVGKGREPPK